MEGADDGAMAFIFEFVVVFIEDVDDAEKHSNKNTGHRTANERENDYIHDTV